MSRSVFVFIPVAALFLVLQGCPSNPQPSVAWSYLPSESAIWGLTIDNTADGGSIIGGGHDGGYDMYALKLNALGQQEWDQAYSNISTQGSHSELWRNEARGLKQTADGGYIMLGAGNNDGDNLPSPAFLLVKTDATGNVVWSKTYAPENPYDLGSLCVNNVHAALDVCSDGGYLAVGSSYVGGYNIASVLKTDAEGNQDFCKVINDNAKAYAETVTGGQQTADGGYVLCGYSDNGSPLGSLALLMKLDADGNLEFSKIYQDVPDDHGAEAYAVTQTADGGYVLGGELINSIGKASTYGCWLAKVDALGNTQWLKAYGHSLTIHYPNTIKETPQGDILAGGANNLGAMTLAKFSADGELVWNFPMPDDFENASVNDMALTADGGCLLVGSGGTGGPSLIAKILHVYPID